MRLIDADALLETVPFTRYCGDLTEHTEGYIDCAVDARVAIKDAPTVDAEPVRHLSRESVYEPFYQWLGQPSSSNLWDELRSMIDDLVEACGAKMDKEDK